MTLETLRTSVFCKVLAWISCLSDIPGHLGGSPFAILYIPFCQIHQRLMNCHTFSQVVYKLILILDILACSWTVFAHLSDHAGQSP